MPEGASAFGAIRLARSRRRLAAGPLAFLLLGGGAVLAGIALGGPAGIALVALGGLAGLGAAYLLALVSSYRLQLEPGGLLLRWFGGERRYRLVRGPVTRVAVSGPGAAPLHPRFAALGWTVGPAILRGEEPIELIRLAAGIPLILVPTDRGRLGIAAKVESDLLAALSSAVRLQERIDEVASRRLAQPPDEAAGPAAPRVLTGIERTLLEQRLAAERAASLAAAAVEREAATATVVVEPAPVALPTPAVVPVAPVERLAPARRATRRRERAGWQRPAWLAVPGPATVVAALPIALPLIWAAIAWIAVAVSGRPELPLGEGRLLLAALVLVGPVGAGAALMTRTWYPRLTGLVAASSMAALAMLTRTVLS